MSTGSKFEITNSRQSSGPAAHGESTQDVRHYLDILKRRWWFVAAAALVALGSSWWNTRSHVPVYSAEVLLEQRRQAPLLGVGGGGGVDFATHVEVIRSRSVAAAVVDSLGLQFRVIGRSEPRSRIVEDVVVDPEAPRGTYALVRSGWEWLLLSGGEDPDTLGTAALDDWIEGPGFRLRVADGWSSDARPLRFSIQEREAAIGRLQRRVRVEPGRGSSLVRIRFSDPDPQLAAAIANGIAAAYQAQRGQAAKEAARRRRLVIANQLVELADSLDAAQDLVMEYQRSSGILNPGSEGSAVVSNMLSTEGELRTLRFQESLLSGLVAGLQRGGDASDESMHQILALGRDLVPAAPGLHQRLQDLELELSRMTASRFGRTMADPQVEVVDSLIRSTKAQIRTAAEQGLDLLRVRIQGAEQQLAVFRAEGVAMPGRTAELARLQQRANAVQSVVDALVNRYYEAQIAEAVETGDIEVIDAAPVPLSPDRGPGRINLLIALIAGMTVGLLGAFGIEYLNPRVRRAAEAHQITGLPVLGLIPKMSGRFRRSQSAALGREAFRSLRTNLRFAPGDQPRILALTSSLPREGKSTVAINLAASFGEENSDRVLLVDADLRRPVLHTLLGVDLSPGLTDVLNGKTSLDEAIRMLPLRNGLFLLPAGRAIPDPAKVLGSDRYTELLNTVRKQFDYVVIDTPPVLAVTDAAVIARAVDGTVFVVRANQADPAAVASGLEQLHKVRARLIGLIFNDVAVGSTDGRYRYAYYEDYLATDAAEKPRQTKGTQPLIPASARSGRTRPLSR